jgi:hypothetical protein
LTTPAILDNVIASAFVDAGQAQLLATVAGPLYVTPSVLDPLEHPPFKTPPNAEFARGLHNASLDLADALKADRARNRTLFFHAEGTLWQAVELSPQELQLAAYFTSRQAREDAQRVMTAQGQVFSAKKVDLGEAECAAVAVTRGWRLLSDDSGIVGLMKAFHPQLPVQRSCGLLVQAVQSKLLSCKDAADLYNEVFKKRWHLFTKLEFRCRGGKPSCE